MQFSAQMVNKNCQYSLNFSGKQCAYFIEGGAFKIVKTENGEVVFDSKRKNCLENPVVCTSWINYNLLSGLDKVNPFKKYKILDHLIMQLGPHIYSDKLEPSN
jgi:hypothetical protein